MEQDSDDKKLEEKIKEAKRIYAEAMAKLDELEKIQKQILEEEKNRANQEQLDMVRKQLQ